MEPTPCASCQRPFVPKRATARFCSAACRARAHRRKAAELPVEEESAGLVASVRRELEEAEVLDTVSGQIAIQLARRVAAVDATGVAGLSKELRQVMAEALASREPAVPVVEDEVERARRQRDAKRRAAFGEKPL